MKHFFLACGLLALATSSAAISPTVPVAQSVTPHQALLTTYCYTCHSMRAKMGGLALEGLDIQAPGQDAPTWEKAVRKLRGRLMPPPGSPQPDQNDIDTFVAWMENNLDAEAARPKAGHVPIQRLNRTEYAAAVKALVGVDVNVNEILPQDIEVDGFDNIAAALAVSPAFVDQYVSAARLIARQAVGDPSIESVNYALAANRGGEGMPLGIRENTGMRVRHNFPADGEYRVTINFPDQTLGLYTGSLENEGALVMMVDGRIMFRKPIGGLEDLMLNNRQAGDGRAKIAERFAKIPIQVHAGVHDVVIAFVERSNFVSTAGFATGSGGGQPNFRDVEIVGPYNPTGVSTLSRELIFVCDSKSAGEAACANQIAENLARRAFRRPVAETEVARLMPFYETGRQEGGDFDQGVERLVAAVLAHPEFLFRAIRGPQAATPDGEAALTDLELASRLSFFLWSSGPDDELLNLAEANRLSRPGVVDAQATRMLNDPRAASLVRSFAMKWLNLDDLDAVKPDPQIFERAFNEALREDFAREVELFIGSILLEDRSVVELLTAKHTFVNSRLAAHYGIPGILGVQFRKIDLTDDARFGLLGKAAVLLRTSYGDRTSPVLRGAWVLDKLQGTPPTPPPPDVESDLSQPAGETPKTVRERLEQHRANPTCRQCHGVIDPLGLPLENFDAIGRWRTTDAQAENARIDASAVLPNGAAINGVRELRAQLASRPSTFAQTFTEKLMMYAINRELEYFDMPQVRAVVRDAAKDNYTLSSIVLGIVNTDAFRNQAPARAE